MFLKLCGMGLMLSTMIATVTPLRAEDAAVQKDLKTLEGEWTVKSQSGDEILYKFKGDKLEVTAPSRSYKMTLKIDPTARPEKTIDFQIDDGPDDAKGKTSKGIYKFADDGKTFIFCFRGEGDRPDKYEQIGYEQILSTLKRKKP
jgi:uncharacterized protein (TIGR03067 family)